MIMPVRCFTCGKVLGSVYETYKKRVDMGEDAAKVMDDLGLERYCCRRMLLSHLDIIDDLKPYG